MKLLIGIVLGLTLGLSLSVFAGQPSPRGPRATSGGQVSTLAVTGGSQIVSFVPHYSIAVNENGAAVIDVANVTAGGRVFSAKDYKFDTSGNPLGANTLDALSAAIVSDITTLTTDVTAYLNAEVTAGKHGL